MRARLMWVALIVLAAPLAPSAAAAIDIVACRQVVPAGQVGRLLRDLDCRAQSSFPFSAEGVRLEGGATLDLNGFAIRGDGSGVGVMCAPGRRRAPCRVKGPGEISGFWAGVNGGGCRLVMKRVLVRGNTNGVYAPLDCDLRGDHLDVEDNLGDGIWVARLRGRTLAVRGNGGRGVVTSRIAARGLAATDNALEGVRQSTTRGRFGRLVDSTVIGNDAAGAGLDIAAAGRLRLRGVRCRRSARLRYPAVVDSIDDVPEIVGSFGCIDD